MNPEAPRQSISYFLSLFSSLFNLYHKVHCSLRFNQNSRLPAPPLLFLLWADTVLGVTGDVPPWGRSLHQGFMVAILRPTPPLPIHPTCHFAFCQLCHALSSLAAFLRHLTTPSLSLISWLTTLPPSSQRTLRPLNRAILTSHYQAQQPTHLLPVPWPFLPPTNQVCLSLSLKIHLLFSSGNLHENPPSFFPAPS